MMRILFATDGSAGSAVALDFLASLPLSRSDPVTVLTVAPHGDRGAGISVAAAAAARLGSRGIVASARVETGPLVNTILAVAYETVADLVIVGSRGRGAVTGALLGSTARGLARAGAVPVLAVRDRHDAPHHVLAAIDGSLESERALALLVRLPLPHSTGATYLQLAPRSPRAAEVILANADRSATDLIVLGLRDQATGRGLLETSLSDQVLSRARCPVLIAAGGFATAAAKSAERARPTVAHPV